VEVKDLRGLCGEAIDRALEALEVLVSGGGKGMKTQGLAVVFGNLLDARMRLVGRRRAAVEGLMEEVLKQIAARAGEDEDPASLAVTVNILAERLRRLEGERTLPSARKVDKEARKARYRALLGEAGSS